MGNKVSLNLSWNHHYRWIFVGGFFFFPTFLFFKSNFKLFGWYNHIMHDYISSHYYSYFWFLFNWCQQESEFNRSLFYLLSYNVGSIIFLIKKMRYLWSILIIGEVVKGFVLDILDFNKFRLNFYFMIFIWKRVSLNNFGEEFTYLIQI